MPYFNIVAETTENTVVTTYEPAQKRSDAYQSEAELEAEFIRQLCEQGYTYLPIHKEADLLANLRTQLETLNGFTFTDAFAVFPFTSTRPASQASFATVLRLIRRETFKNLSSLIYSSTKSPELVDSVL